MRQEGLNEDNDNIFCRNKTCYLNYPKAKRGNGRKDRVLGIVQSYAQLAVRFVGRICIEVAVRNRSSRDRGKGQDHQHNQHSTNAKMVHSERFYEMIVCALSIVNMILALHPRPIIPFEVLGELIEGGRCRWREADGVRRAGGYDKKSHITLASNVPISEY